MADQIFTLQDGEVALVAATAKTIIQVVAPANHRVKVLRWGVFFDGVVVTAEPIQVELTRQSTAGTSVALTPVKNDDSLAESILSTARKTFTAEPTSGDIIDVVEVHPQQGYEIIYPMGQEKKCGGGDRVGIRCTAPAAVNVRAKMEVEE